VRDQQPARLFVYGTLRPGDVRWPLLAPFVVDDGWDDHVAGTLFDTGLGFPAASFHPGDGWIVGRTFGLLEASIERCLEILDLEEETADGRYRRVRVQTRRGLDAWAYEYGEGYGLTPIASYDWFARR
jgi:gamma-glutamylcyclotransferase (GGCT)/AIG2-like uncharacterized protein YtfP